MENRCSDYTKYKKSVILLDEENADFAGRRDYKIRGDLRIETGNNKGAMSLNVRNLRVFERNKYIYKLILLGEKRERTIYAVMGTLSLNRYGDGENYFRFSPADIDVKGNNLEDFSVAIVAAVSMRNDKEPLHPVLKGVLDNTIAPPNGGDSTQDNTQDKNDDWECENCNRKPHRDGDCEQGNYKHEQHKYGEVLVNAEPANTVCEKNNPIHNSEIYCKANPNLESNCKQTIQTYNNYYAQFLCEHCQHLADVCEKIEEIKPFTEDTTHTQWKRMSGLSGFPIVSPGAQKNASKYGHYLFGHHDEMYYFAVPGRFIDEEYPDNGKSGFSMWQPIRGAEGFEADKEGCPLETRMAAYGYWILAVRKETGEIVDI